MPKRHAEVHWIRVGHEVVVARFETRQFHVLNATGALIWELLDGSITLDKLSVEVADAFELDAEAVRVELAGFVASAQESGLLDG